MQGKIMIWTEICWVLDRLQFTIIFFGESHVERGDFAWTVF